MIIECSARHPSREKRSIKMDASALLNFIAERELIRRRRAAGEPMPWTNDPILQTWSFTNVRREDDRVTRSVATNWREPHCDDPDL
jgi:5-hmdU DNA kinase-like protein